MLVFVIAAAFAGAPPADPPTPVAPAVVTSDKKKDADDPDKMICKSQPSPGSRMTTRVCATRLQWQRNEEASRDMMREAQEKGTVGANSGPSQGMRTP